MIGRVIGFDFMFFFGGVAVGNLVIGNIADRLGISMIIQLIGTLMVFTAVILYFGRNLLQPAIREREAL